MAAILYVGLFFFFFVFFLSIRLCASGQTGVEKLPYILIAGRVSPAISRLVAGVNEGK